jgi:hypothetical protein
MENRYSSYVDSYMDHFTKVELELREIVDLAHRVVEVIKRKQHESHYKIDGVSKGKRWLTGWSGEKAVGKYLGLDFSDYSVGNSHDYDEPDLASVGYGVGVKSVCKGDFPLIKKPRPSYQVTQPQIIVLKEDHTTYRICGVASPEILNEKSHYSDLLVKSSDVLSRGEKSAFYRFDLLKHNFTLEDLEPYRLTKSR